MKHARHHIIALLLALLPLAAAARDTMETLVERARQALEQRGDYPTALKLYREALAAPAGDGALRCVALLNQAECHKSLGHYTAALAALRQAERQARHESPVMVDRVRLALAELHTASGRYDLADSALHAIPADGWYAVSRRFKLADLDYRRGHKLSALRSLNRLVDDLQGTDKTTVHNRAVALQNRAFVRTSFIDSTAWTAALADIDSALALLPADALEHQLALSNKAVLESRLGLAAQAQAHIAQARAWMERHYNTKRDSLVDYTTILRKQALIALRAGDKKTATKLYKTYYNKERAFLLRNFALMNEQERLNLWKREKPLLGPIFELGDTDPRFLLDVALMRRQMAFVGGDSTPAATIERQLAVTAEQVCRAVKKGEVAIDFVRYNRDDGNAYAALVVRPGGKVDFVALGTENALCNLVLDDGSRLIDAVRATDSSAKNAIYTSHNLARRIWTPLQPFLQEATTVCFVPDGLLQLLAVEYLPAEALQDKTLHRLTSLALLCRDTKKTTLPQGTLLVGGLDYYKLEPLDGRGNREVNHDALRYLNDHNIFLTFNTLDGMRTEVDSIERFFAVPLKLHERSEELFKQGMGSYRTIHLATHGYSVDVDVDDNVLQRDDITVDNSLLACGVTLSGVNVAKYFPNRDDGLLSGRELCALPLHNVDLVVLSACQTAQGRVNDEGPVGLVRGLKKAGARTIMASLWPVNDRATMLLMQYFYDAWREGRGSDGKGCSKTRALQLARERLKATGRPRTVMRVFNAARQKATFEPAPAHTYAAPSFWAPFVLIDDI